MKPYYEDDLITLYHADCLAVLRTLPDSSVDAIVTDPPYGLSNTKPAQVADVLKAWVTGDTEVVPGLKKDSLEDAFVKALKHSTVTDSDDLDSKTGKEFVPFSVPLGAIPVSMFRPVNLNDNAPSGEKEIDGDGMSFKVEHLLRNDGDTEGGEGVSGNAFRLRRRSNAPCSVSREGDSARIRVSVWLGDNSFTESEGSSSVMAGGATEVVAMLSLDVGRGTAEFLPADSALPGDFILTRSCAETVGALTRTGGLPSVLESGEVGEVDTSADGAGALDVIVGLPMCWHESHSSTSKGFMGASWDGFVPPPAVWEECMRVLKPGGHMAVFAGARTQDLMGLSIRLAGFEIRDTLGWIYGSGFPKSHDIGKAIDKYNGNPLAFRGFTAAYREAVAKSGLTHSSIDKALGIKSSSCYWARDDHRGGMPPRHHWEKVRGLVDVPAELASLYDEAEREITQKAKRDHVAGDAIKFDQRGSHERERRDIPVTEAASRWDGWGTALKPAIEPILLVQKPFNVVPLYEVVNKTHHILGALKWLSLSPAKRAKITSTSNHQEPHAEMCASALANAETEQSPEKYDATDTFRSPEMALTYLNTEKLWQSMLGAISDPTITFTTSTESSTITVLKTLNSLLGQITSATTMPPCECLLNGQPSSVINVESNSSESWSNWQATLNVSVPESVIEQTAKTALSLLANIAENLSQPGTAAGGGSVLSHAQIELITQSGESQNDHANGAGSLTSLVRIRGGSVPLAARQKTNTIEPIILARKPLVGTVAANVLAHGVGGLNIDACRVPHDEPEDHAKRVAPKFSGTAYNGGKIGGENNSIRSPAPAGRFPANVLLDEHAAQEMDKQSVGTRAEKPSKSGSRGATVQGATWKCWGESGEEIAGHNDSGGASRFFPVFKYQAKAPKRERPVIEREDGTKIQHPTVKPEKLMEWLVTLITPPGGVVLDPFAGSGTTLQAARDNGFNAIGVEQSADFVELIQHRLGAGQTTLTVDDVVNDGVVPDECESPTIANTGNQALKETQP